MTSRATMSSVSLQRFFPRLQIQANRDLKRDGFFPQDCKERLFHLRKFCRTFPAIHGTHLNV